MCSPAQPLLTPYSHKHPPNHPPTQTHPQEGKVKWVERSHGSFVRRFALPDRGVDAAGITAALKDGVMTVTIPKVAAEEPAAKEIPISTE